MADTKTSDETSATVLTGAELVRVVQSATSKKTTAALMGHQFRGCRIERTTNLTAQNYTGSAAIVFQTATLDTDSFFSAGTPSRGTIPSSKGFKVANVSANVRIQNNTSDTWIALALIHRNSAGTGYRSSRARSEVGIGNADMGATMIAVPLVDGDYFDVLLTAESDTSIDIMSEGTALSIEIIGMEP